jgi:hypothetical protein
MLVANEPSSITEQQIADYALNPANQERFAELLTKILPHYAAWSWGQDSVYRRYFNRWQKAGFNLTPNHYYSPIPNVARLDPKLWDSRSAMTGIDLRAESQLKFLNEVCSRFRREYEQFPRQRTSVPHQFYLENGAYEKVDAEVLHCMMRHYRPRRVIEIGSGCSTLVTAAALELNRAEGSAPCHFTAIEPYPTPVFRHRIPSLTELLQLPLENVDPALFGELSENDVLFIDSTHVVRCGSDVNRIYLDILPRLKPGVIVHVHDIFLPAEYPKHWVFEEHVFWTEQYLLQAFLAFNREFEVLWSGSYMHMEHSSELARHMPSYRNDGWPGSFWMRRIAATPSPVAQTADPAVPKPAPAPPKPAPAGSAPLAPTTAGGLKLNLGACDRRIPGFLSVDVVPPADVIADLTKAWPWADSSVDEVRAFDVFEHLPDKRHTMNELWRVLRPGGVARLQIPHATDGDGGHCDPTHVSYWTTSDFEYYAIGIPERERFRNSSYYGVKADFKVLSVQLQRYERRFGGYVVEMQVDLEAVK